MDQMEEIQKTATPQPEIDLNSFDPEALRHIPQQLITDNTELVLGIDEAGRGPLLGPMVYGCCFGPVSEMKTVIPKMGFNDSKKMTEVERENLFNKMKKHPSIGWIALSLEPEVLSEKMLRVNKVSLNTISHDAAIFLLRTAKENGLNVKKVFVDTVGTPAKYQSKLISIFPEMDIVVSKKADSKYPIVGGASIVAKVIRDYRLKFWKWKEDLDRIDKNYGSGYPSDPLTQQWLRKNIDPVFGSPSLVRFSWRPSIEILNKTAFDVCWSLEDDDDDEQTNRELRAKRSSNLKIKDRGTRYRYFAENNMEVVEEGFL